MYGWAAYHCQQYQNIECCTKNHLWKQRKVVSSSCKVVDIFVRFQPKSNFLDKCSQFLSDFYRSRIFLTKYSQFLSDFYRSRIFLTNTPRRKLCDEDIISKLTCDTDWDHGARTPNARGRKMLMVVTNVPSLLMQQERIMTWALRSMVNLTHFCQNTGCDGSKKQNEASHINKDSSRLWAFLLCFRSAIDLLVAGGQILLLIFGKTWRNAKPASRHNKFWNKTKE